MLIDTHCHVHFNAYKQDMDDVIKRTLDHGVQMITIGTQKDTSRAGLEVAERYDGLWATIGLHPNHLTEQEFFDEDELPPEKSPPLAGSRPKAGQAHGDSESYRRVKTRSETFDPAYYRELVKHPKCVAIGECGLDYYRIPESADLNEVKKKQEAAVRAQFDLASEADKPVVVHCRDGSTPLTTSAHADQQRIIREYLEAGKLKRRGVVHCFTGTLEEANAYIDLGFLISFTGVITFPPRKGHPSTIRQAHGGEQSRTTSSGHGGYELSPLQAVVKALPLDSIMVETDAPYLTPVPYRGKRNEPWYVVHVAQKIAELKGVSMDEISAKTTANAKQLFRLPI